MTSTFQVDIFQQLIKKKKNGFPRKQIGWKRNSYNIWWLLGKLPQTYFL